MKLMLYGSKNKFSSETRYRYEFIHQRLNAVLLNPDYIILLSDALLTELDQVIHRPKFQRYLSLNQIEQFTNLLLERAQLIQPTSIVRVSPDPKDDFLLALCRDGRVDYLLTGNKIDLLDLKQFETTHILTLTEFLSRQ